MDQHVGKVAVVTGSSAGIGEAVSKELLKYGVIVVGLARRVHKLQELAAEISNDKKTYSGEFHGLQCDIKNDKEVEAVFRHITSTIGPISILINNAGVLENENLTTVENFDEIFQTNVKGLLVCTQEAMKSMNCYPNSTGYIINVNSQASLPYVRNPLRYTLYAASKRATKSLSEVMRRQVSRDKQLIKITDILPGTILTQMTEKYADNLTNVDILSAEEVAKVMVTVLSTPKNVLIAELFLIPLHQRWI